MSKGLPDTFILTTVLPKFPYINHHLLFNTLRNWITITEIIIECLKLLHCQVRSFSKNMNMYPAEVDQHRMLLYNSSSYTFYDHNSNKIAKFQQRRGSKFQRDQRGYSAATASLFQFWCTPIYFPCNIIYIHISYRIEIHPFRLPASLDSYT